MSASEPNNTARDILRLRDEFARRAQRENDTARQLEEQARAARAAAQQLQQQSQIMQQAYALLQKEESEKVVANAAAAFDLQLTGKNAKNRFVFLIDGSGSMNDIFGHAVDSIHEISKKISAKGGSVDVIVFGNHTPVMLDINNESQRLSAKRGLNSGTDMAPSLQGLASLLPANKPAHVIVVSDGDIFDKQKSQEKLNAILASFPKVQLSTVVAQNSAPPQRVYKESFRSVSSQSEACMTMQRKTQMEEMMEGLTVANDRVKTPVMVVPPSNVGQAIAATLAQQLEQLAAKPVLRRPKPHKNAPGQ